MPTEIAIPALLALVLFSLKSFGKVPVPIVKATCYCKDKGAGIGIIFI